MTALLVTNYVHGPKRRQITHPIVTCVLPRDIMSFAGSWDRVEVQQWLRRLAEDGILIRPEGRSTKRLQSKHRTLGLVYVFACEPEFVPRIGRPRRRARVLAC